jgi:hypothetical protein
MLHIKDKEYELKFPVNTLCMMAEDNIDVMNIENIPVNLKTIRDLFYYGLKYENKKITKNQAGDLMDDYLEDGGNIYDLFVEIMNALAKSLGKGKADKEDNSEDNDSEAEGK